MGSRAVANLRPMCWSMVFALRRRPTPGTTPTPRRTPRGQDAVVDLGVEDGEPQPVGGEVIGVGVRATNDGPLYRSRARS